MTSDGIFSANISLGTHQTISSLFEAVEDAFATNNDDFIAAATGSLHKLVLLFPMNLGDRFLPPRILYVDDDNKKLQAMRWDIYCAYNEYREEADGEVVIVFGTAFA
jgi:hypothetical protein